MCRQQTFDLELEIYMTSKCNYQMVIMNKTFEFSLSWKENSCMTKLNEIVFILCYRSTSFNRYIFCFDDTLQRDHKEYENVCVFGDFNFPEILWNNACHHNISSLKEDFSHIQINNKPSNCKGNIIYLVFSNVTEKM